MLYEKAGNLFNELKDITDIGLKEPPIAQGTLRLFLTVSPAILYLTSLTTQFMKMYPAVVIDFKVGSESVDVYQYVFDLAISFDVIQHPNMMCKKIFSIQRSIYGSPEYLNAYGNPASPDELLHHNCLINTLYGLQNKWILKKKILHISGNFKSNNADVLKQAALNGAGLIWVPYFSVREDVEAGKLVPVLPHEKSPEIMLYAIYKKHKNNNNLIDLFLNFICEQIVNDDVIELD